MTSRKILFIGMGISTGLAATAALTLALQSAMALQPATLPLALTVGTAILAVLTWMTWSPAVTEGMAVLHADTRGQMQRHLLKLDAHNARLTFACNRGTARMYNAGRQQRQLTRGWQDSLSPRI